MGRRQQVGEDVVVAHLHAERHHGDAQTAQQNLAAETLGPLKGIRVIDLTSVVLGAYATQMLGDMGADVIKVEFPGSGRGGGGDIMRWAGHTPDETVRDLGPIYMTINRNKRAVLLDLRDAAVMEKFKALISTADVFAASVRYEGLKRLGLGYEEVKAIRPDIVYVHAAGYGSDGPYAGEPAYDDLIQAASGFGVDEVIDPRATRARLIDILERTPPRRASRQPPKYRSISPI